VEVFVFKLGHLRNQTNFAVSPKHSGYFSRSVVSSMYTSLACNFFYWRGPFLKASTLMDQCYKKFFLGMSLQLLNTILFCFVFIFIYQSKSIHDHYSYLISIFVLLHLCILYSNMEAPFLFHFGLVRISTYLICAAAMKEIWWKCTPTILS
jgi:hypothetical protein